MSFLIEQKLLENAKIEKLTCDILGNFKTLWNVSIWRIFPNENFK